MLWETMAGRSGSNRAAGFNRRIGKPHVRWCGRVTARNIDEKRDVCPVGALKIRAS
jgi:hypothetical protein